MGLMTAMRAPRNEALRMRWPMMGWSLRTLAPTMSRPSTVSSSSSVHPSDGTIGAVETLVAEPVAIGDPGLVDRLVFLRQRAHHAIAALVQIDIGADAVVRRDARDRDELPTTGGVGERV